MRKPKGIVITTSAHTEQWFDACYDSVKDLGYPILVVVNAGEVDHEGKKFESEFMESNEGKFMVQVNNWNGFEMGGILRGTEHFDEFIHLMDTCVITNPEAIERMFEHKGSMYFCRGFFSYLGKYISDIAIKTGIPKVEDKEAAIFHEHAWHRKYLANDPNAKQFDPALPVTTEIFEEKNGRNNMVIDNGFIKKWKATYR